MRMLVMLHQMLVRGGGGAGPGGEFEDGIAEEDREVDEGGEREAHEEEEDRESEEEESGEESEEEENLRGQGLWASLRGLGAYVLGATPAVPSSSDAGHEPHEDAYAEEPLD